MRRPWPKKGVEDGCLLQLPEKLPLGVTSASRLRHHLWALELRINRDISARECLPRRCLVGRSVLL